MIGSEWATPKTVRSGSEPEHLQDVCDRDFTCKSSAAGGLRKKAV
ncbi:MAG: selenium-binding family protein [Planctomycetes bacterium]|nr:selenium-binding family protein [Planctomycetota bacterium]